MMINIYNGLPVAGSEIGGSAELRKRKHEDKTGGNWGELFECLFFFCIFPTIRKHGTG